MRSRGVAVGQLKHLVSECRGGKTHLQRAIEEAVLLTKVAEPDQFFSNAPYRRTGWNVGIYVLYRPVSKIASIHFLCILIVNLSEFL
jgi:hypothetical protein